MSTLIQKMLMILVILSFSLIGQITNAQELEDENPWTEFTGTNYCEKNLCANDINKTALRAALKFYKNNQSSFKNHDYLGIIDFNLPSTQKRFFILNLKTGEVTKLLVTHGKKSETEKSIAGNFSNEIGSEMSSLGFYRTGIEPYEGKHGTSLKLYGLSETNSNAFDRGIVIHSADYATQSFVDEMGRLGLSQGCPAVSPNKIEMVIEKLKGRALLFIYSNQLKI